MEHLTSTLVKRVQTSIDGSEPTLERGRPVLSTTPTPVSLQQLALQLARAEKTLREIALDVHVIGHQVRELAGLSFGEQPAPAPLAAVPAAPRAPTPEDPAADPHVALAAEWFS